MYDARALVDARCCCGVLQLLLAPHARWLFHERGGETVHGEPWPAGVSVYAAWRGGARGRGPRRPYKFYDEKCVTFRGHTYPLPWSQYSCSVQVLSQT